MVGWLLGHGLLADKKWLDGCDPWFVGGQEMVGWLGLMVCWLTRNVWLVGAHGLLADKKWLGYMVCWMTRYSCMAGRRWFVG